MWANWCQPMCSFSYNTKALPNGLSSYAEAWDPKFKERIIVISMRITQAIAPLLAAAHHATKKPLAQCLPEWQAGIERMKELRPNIMQVSSNYPQAQQLNETGECDLFMSPDSRTTLFRKSQGAPVDQGYAEGRRVRDAGWRRAGRRRAEPGRSASRSSTRCSARKRRRYIAKTFHSKPTNTKTVLPAGLNFPDLIPLDWEYFADNRNAMIERFEREVSAR